jgi:hypothetical protein
MNILRSSLFYYLSFIELEYLCDNSNSSSLNNSLNSSNKGINTISTKSTTSLVSSKHSANMSSSSIISKSKKKITHSKYTQIFNLVIDTLLNNQKSKDITISDLTIDLICKCIDRIFLRLEYLTKNGSKLLISRALHSVILIIENIIIDEKPNCLQIKKDFLLKVYLFIKKNFFHYNFLI